MSDLISAVVLSILQPWVAAVGGLVIVAEGLNKLERTARSTMGLRSRWQIVNLLKVAAWLLLVLGGGGAIAVPALRLGEAWLQVAFSCVVLGFAVLIVRTRIKEG